MSFHQLHVLHLSSALKKVTQLPINIYKNNMNLSLDISLIDSGIMVCSYPVIATKRQLVRNKLHDLINYLNTTYGYGNWRLYNLKSEIGEADYTNEDLLNSLPLSCNHTQEDILNSVPSMFNASMDIDNREGWITSSVEHSAASMIQNSNELDSIFSRNGWLDHCPPPFELLQEIIDDMDTFLSENKRHICVIHCKMGKGRSGTVCVAYLMKYRNLTFEDSMDMFTEGRFKRIISQGVTIKSQLRYLQYHNSFISFDSRFQKFLLKLLRTDYSPVLHFVTVKGPTKLFLSDHISCWLSLKRYNPTRTELITIDKINLSTHMKNDTDVGYDGENQGNLKFPILMRTADVMFEFDIKLNHWNSNDNCLIGNSLKDRNTISGLKKKIKDYKKIYAWVNVFLESIDFPPLSEIPESLKLPDRNILLTLTWGELDTVLLSKKAGLKLFESIEFGFEQTSSYPFDVTNGQT
ncbi:Telomerase protein component 1 [Monosporozyma unispora]|nr:Telomerase protein component 1 [Kazachstania unispora]